MRKYLMVKPILRWAAGVGLVVGGIALLSATVGADDAAGTSVTQQNYNAAADRLEAAYNGLLAQGTQPGPYTPPAPAATNGEEKKANGEEEKKEEEQKADEPWTFVSLFDDGCGHNCLKDHGTTIAGWTEWGFQSKPDGAFTGNGPFLDDREWRKFNLNQGYLYAEKVADGSKGFGWGYRADLMYGVDGNEGQSFGNRPGHWDFLNGWDHGIYEWAMPQLYGELAYDKYSVKLGHFYTPTGYEVVQPGGNFFFSRQILWYNAEPFTHTGALGTYKANDKLTIQAGWILGWDTGFDQFNGGNMGVANVTYAWTDKTTVTYFGAWGNSGWRGSQNFLNGVIVIQKWTDKFSTVHQFDVLGTNNDSDPVAPGGNFAVDGIVGDSTGMVHYAFYDITDKLKVGARFEWDKFDSVSYYTMTYGFNIKPHPNFLIRPEVRHLWAPGVPGGPPGTIANNVATVFGNSTVFGIDVLTTF